jgi:type III pantothenate kinase
VTVVLDLRNGFFSVGIHSRDRWLRRKRFGLAEARTADDYALLFRFLAQDSGIGQEGADKAIISSVVPGRTAAVRKALGEVFRAEPLVVGPGLKTGLKIRTDIPSELGTDLVCLSVAAHARVPGDVIVVESGSCLTFSAVSAQGEFLGASIAPGPQLAAAVMRESAALLPEVQIAKPSRYIGKNTAQSLSSGIVNGYIGLMDGIIAGMQAEMGGEVALVGSGTEEEAAIRPSKGFTLYDPWLSLEGLLLLSQRN